MSEETLFEFEADRSRAEIAASLRALAAEFDGDGPVTLRDGDAVVSVTPPGRAELAVEVERESEGEESEEGESELEIEVEIEWAEAGSAEEPDPDPEAGVRLTPEDDSDPSQARFEVYEDRANEWRWRLVHRNGNVIADGGEGYASKRNAIRGLGGVKRNAPGAPVRELE